MFGGCSLRCRSRFARCSICGRSMFDGCSLFSCIGGSIDARCMHRWMAVLRRCGVDYDDEYGDASEDELAKYEYGGEYVHGDEYGDACKDGDDHDEHCGEDVYADGSTDADADEYNKDVHGGEDGYDPWVGWRMYRW